MHERGTYGRQASTNSYGTYGHRLHARPPAMGMDAEVKRVAVDVGFNMIVAVGSTLAGAWLGGRATPKDQNKGVVIGGAVGYFASLLMRQNFALERIADYTRIAALS